MKKIIALAVTLLLCVGLSSFVFASEEPIKVNAYSNSFPDAYILIEKPNQFGRFSSSTDDFNVSATVFVSESYEVKDGEVVVTASELLSKAEVDQIGVKNFEEFNSIDKKAVRAKAASNSYYKLSINMSGTYSYVGNGVSCDLTGNAGWSGLSWSNMQGPASGVDFIGITWAGDFTANNSYCNATDNIGLSVNTTMCGSSPNAGRVWSFYEYPGSGRYVDDIDVGTTLTKNTLTGSGNTASAVLKYVHTYQSRTGSVTIEASSSGVGAGYTVSNVDKQWPLVVTVTGIPY